MSTDSERKAYDLGSNGYEPPKTGSQSDYQSWKSGSDVYKTQQDNMKMWQGQDKPWWEK